jgi:hypothetical protein
VILQPLVINEKHLNEKQLVRFSNNKIQ